MQQNAGKPKNGFGLVWPLGRQPSPSSGLEPRGKRRTPRLIRTACSMQVIFAMWNPRADTYFLGSPKSLLILQAYRQFGVLFIASFGTIEESFDIMLCPAKWEPRVTTLIQGSIAWEVMFAR